MKLVLQAIPSVQTLELENLEEIRGGANRVLVLLAILLSFLPFFSAQEITNTSQIVGSYRPSLSPSLSPAPLYPAPLYTYSPTITESASESATESATESMTETMTETETETETALTDSLVNSSILSPQNIVEGLTYYLPKSTRRSVGKFYYALSRAIALSNVLQSDDIGRVYGLTMRDGYRESALRLELSRINKEEEQFLHSIDIGAETPLLLGDAQLISSPNALQVYSGPNALQVYSPSAQSNTQIVMYKKDNSTALVITGEKAAETYRRLDTDGRLLRLQVQADAVVAREYVRNAACSGAITIAPVFRNFLSSICDLAPRQLESTPAISQSIILPQLPMVPAFPERPQNDTVQGTCLLLMAYDPGNTAAPGCGALVSQDLVLANALINTAAQIRLERKEVVYTSNASTEALSALAAPDGVANLYNRLTRLDVTAQVSAKTAEAWNNLTTFLSKYWFYAKYGTIALGAAYMWWNTYTIRAIQSQGRDIREIRRVMDALRQGGLGQQGQQGQGIQQAAQQIKDIWAFNTRGTLILYKDDAKQWFYVGQGEGAARLRPIPAQNQNLIPQNLKDLVAGVYVPIAPYYPPPIPFYPPPQVPQIAPAQIAQAQMQAQIAQAQMQAQIAPAQVPQLVQIAPQMAQMNPSQQELDQVFATAQAIKFRIQSLRYQLQGQVADDV